MRTCATTTTTAALLLVALTACSSSDNSEASTDPATAPPAVSSSAAAAFSAPPVDDGSATLKIVVMAYTDAYFAGDVMVAWEMLSTRCQGEISPEAYIAVVKQAAADYGPGHPATDVQAEVSGNMARVSYQVQDLPKFNQTKQPWALEGGVWKYDAC